MKTRIQNAIGAECPWRDTLHWFSQVTSTNILAKEMASQGAPHGTVVLAGSQTAGRGRMGRSFSSPEGKGIYLSLILRPGCPAHKLMHLTCAVGVAMCDAIEKVYRIRPRIKWINDLVLGKKKLGGILTELCVSEGIVQYAIIGIGINCTQTSQDFPPEIRDIAVSLQEFTGKAVDTAALTGAMIDALYEMDRELFTRDFITTYQADCITLGQEISVVRGDTVRHGKAIGITPNGGLLVEFPHGEQEIVESGEVSIRGMYGYI